MADVLYVYDVTCPAETAPASALEVETVLQGNVQVTQIDLVIPEGHAGLTGIGIAYGHNVVIPLNVGAFISGDDEVFKYPLSLIYPAGVGWSVFLCNNDVIAHSWETRWYGNMIATAVTPIVSAPIATDDLTAAVADVDTGP